MSAMNFQMPNRVTVEKISDLHAAFIFEPLEKGYGVTIGNALRRVLLSSLQGYAITSLKIPGVQHEFSTIEGVMEDVVQIVLNLKRVRFKKVNDNPESRILIPLKNQTQFKASDIAKATASFEVLNPELVICHLEKSVNLEVEITVEKGRGYWAAEESKPDYAAIGLIGVDAIFTPIVNVEYRVENTRVEQKTDYEKLTLEVKTDGSLTPEVAMQETAAILIDHFSLIADKDLTPAVKTVDEETGMDEEMVRIRKLLKKSLSELGLSARAFNCLKAAGVRMLADLVRKDLSEVAKFRNLGKKSLVELEEVVEKMNLTFGMDLSKYKLD